MKGKIIDYNYFDAFVALEDDTVVKVPLAQVSNNLSIGSLVNINSNDLGCNNNPAAKMHYDKIVDFF